MKREDARKAISDAFVATLSLEYSNALIFTLALDRPDRPGAEARFRKMLANNIEAYGMAMRAIADNPDLE